MITKKGWDRNLMMSLFAKETTYNSGVDMTTYACSMKGFENETTWEDKVENDKESITGTEFGTEQEIISKGLKMTYKEAKVKPNSLAGLASLALGSTNTTAVTTAFRHKIVPVTVGTELPSIQVEEKMGGLQYAYKGIKANTLKIAGEAGGILSVESELMGSGERVSSSTEFAASLEESWLKVSQCKVYMENGDNISINSTLTQGAQDISAVTPADIGPRLKSFEWSWSNNLEAQEGFGSDVKQDLDYLRRSVELKLTLLFNDATELDYYLNQTPIAVEFDLAGADITGSTLKYGAHLIIPKFQLKAAPIPKGGAGDALTVEFDCDVQDDGTNAVSIIEVYNAQPSYLV